MNRLGAVAVILVGLASLSGASELDALWPPCDLDGPITVMDGGSQVGTIFDAFGNRVDFIFLRRLPSPGEVLLNHRLYLGSRDWPEGSLVERHSEEEQLFIGILQRWINDRISAKQQEAYLNFRNDDPEYAKRKWEYLAKFTEEEKQALAAVLLIDSIKHEPERVEATQEEIRALSNRSRER